MSRLKYKNLKISIFPQKIQWEYIIANKTIDGHAYIKIVKEMYGLPQAGLVTNKLLPRDLQIMNNIHPWFVKAQHKTN